MKCTKCTYVLAQNCRFWNLLHSLADNGLGVFEPWDLVSLDKKRFPLVPSTEYLRSSPRWCGEKILFMYIWIRFPLDDVIHFFLFCWTTVCKFRRWQQHSLLFFWRKLMGKSSQYSWVIYFYWKIIKMLNMILLLGSRVTSLKWWDPKPFSAIKPILN